MLNAVVGFAGLPATLAALEHGKRLALANKESLIAGGPVVAKAARPRRRRDRPGRLASTPRIYQCLRAGDAARGRAASCSPRAAGRSAARPRAELEHVTVADALAAPHLGHGRQDHHRLVDAHEQGPRGDRGARAVRRRLRPDRRRRAPAVGRARHGRVHRRRDRSPSSRCPTCGSRSASRSARPTGSTEPFGAIDWTTLGALTFETPDRRGVPVPRPRLRGRPGRRRRPGGAQRGQRGGGRGVPRRADPVAGASPTWSRRCSHAGHRERRGGRRRSRSRPGRARARAGAIAVARTEQRSVKDPLEEAGSRRRPRAAAPASSLAAGPARPDRPRRLRARRRSHARDHRRHRRS